jgi:DEAD/DEAH box helicase domain-containing protein
MEGDHRIRHVHHRPAVAGHRLPFPEWVSPEVIAALETRGISTLWQHQVTAAEALFAGRHVAIGTGTASGKSLAYLLPIIAATRENRLGWELPPSRHRLTLPGRRHTALYLAPTKALAHDQLRVTKELELPEWKVSALDGDSDPVERRFAREFAHLVFSNPDMLHRSILPSHQRWAAMLGSLRFVVVDEAHRYRGLFGAHVASVLRRLRRLCRHHGSDPVFLAASATVGDPGRLLATLAGVDPVLAVTEDASARPELDFVLWQPEAEPHREAALMAARLVEQERQSLVFTSSRVQAELVADRLRDQVAEPERVAAYRAGYLAGDRREIEQGLGSGRLRAVACTNALELGVDISGMDAVITVGFPGSAAALWQQVGRAGRSRRPALAVLVARPDPLDAYLCDHPDFLHTERTGATVLHPENPVVLARHLAAAAQELPLTASDSAWFGDSVTALADRLTAQGVLRRRAAGWFWTSPQRAVDAIDLRSSGNASIGVVEQQTGRVVGHVDVAAADRTVHEGAVYLHQGEQWLIGDYDPAAHVALARRVRTGYYTQPQSVDDARIVRRDEERELGAGRLAFGLVELSSQVTGYLRRDEVTGEVWDSTSLELPTRHLVTQSVWWTLDRVALAATNVPEADLAGAAHAAEHAAIGLLPMFAPCDRWDIGGRSTVRHPDNGQLTVFVHDGFPGGAGFAAKGYELAERWLSTTLDRLLDCRCEIGCPRCVVSPKCGNGNNPLNKAGAIALLRHLAA